MKQIKYHKTENIIEDTCIVYGICKILKDNIIEYTLMTKENCYIIKYDEEDIDEEGLIFNDLTEDDCKNVNGTYFTEIKKGALIKINDWFNKNINNLLEDINNKEIINKLDDKTIAIGTHFYTLSKSFKTGNNTSTIKRNLAFLGYITYSILVVNSTHDMNFLMIPKVNSEIKNIIRPSEIKITSKKNGEVFVKKMFDKEKVSEIELESLIYLKTLHQYYFEKDDYERIFIMQYKQAGNKPLADIYYDIKLLKLSKDGYKQFENIISCSKNYNIKDITSKFILNSIYNNFSKMMKIYGKFDQKISKDIGEEIINMYSEKVKNIFLNKNIQRLGQGLGLLTSKKRGFEILTQLYSVSNELHITRIINRLSDEYLRTFNKYLLNSDEIQEVINLMNDKKDAKIIADAIISYGRNFYVKKDNEQK